MNGDRLRKIVLVAGQGGGWPGYFVVTDAGVYEYQGSTFAAVQKCPEGQLLALPPECEGRRIVEARCDGESAVLLMETDWVVLFVLAVDPFGKEVESWPIVRFEAPDQWRAWRHEFDEMEVIPL